MFCRYFETLTHPLVRPVEKTDMCHVSLFVSEQIFNVEQSAPAVTAFFEFNQFNFERTAHVLFFVAGREIATTFVLASFANVRQHHNSVCLFLPDHSPKVNDSFCQRSLMIEYVHN